MLTPNTFYKVGSVTPCGKYPVEKYHTSIKTWGGHGGYGQSKETHCLGPIIFYNSKTKAMRKVALLNKR